VSEKKIKKTSIEHGDRVSMAVNTLENAYPPIFICFQESYSETNSFVFDLLVFVELETNQDGKQKWHLSRKQCILRTCLSPPNPAQLVPGNRSLPVGCEALDVRYKIGSNFILVPSHCLHRLKPLKVSVYFPFKVFFENGISVWLRSQPEKSPFSILKQS
jgi:hypothetical protein